MGSSSAPGISAPPAKAAASSASAPAPSDRRLIQAAAANGSSSGHDMWICISQAAANPIAAKARGADRRRRLKVGTASKKPRKKTIAGARMYDVLMMCVENCSVHGIVRNQPQINHRGTAGSCRHAYHASAAIAANDSRFSSTKGASGIARMRSGRPTSMACSAPGISLRVQTTSGPKKGQADVAW